MVAPSNADAVAGVIDGSIAGTISPIDLSDEGQATTIQTPVPSFYHVACNVRNQPLNNPHFRRVVARLLDKEWLVENVFDGQARPASRPIANHKWVPERLRWDGDDPEVPFFGTDGTVAAETAREALTTAGYQYDSEGYLLGRAN